MQTFLPWPEFELSAQALDDKRLGKQRSEGLSILSALTFPEQYPLSLRNHPAVLMWKGYERALSRYVCAICVEYVNRGFKDAVESQVIHIRSSYYADTNPESPQWLGLNMLHENHRGRLMIKHPTHYVKKDFGRVPYCDVNLWPITKRGSWMYMIEGKIVSQLMSKPEYRLATEMKKQCAFCNYWWNGGDLIHGYCPTCIENMEAIQLIAELSSGDADDKQLAKELLKSISTIIYLTRTGRM